MKFLSHNANKIQEFKNLLESKEYIAAIEASKQLGRKVTASAAAELYYAYLNSRKPEHAAQIASLFLDNGKTLAAAQIAYEKFIKTSPTEAAKIAEQYNLGKEKLFIALKMSTFRVPGGPI